MRRDFLLFDLLMLFVFIVFTMVLLYAPYMGTVDLFVPLACLIFCLIATYNLGLHRGMLLAIALTFAYGTYIIYDAFLAEGRGGVQFVHVLWMTFFPLGGMLSGNLAQTVTRYKSEMESKRTLEKLVSIDENTGFYKQHEFFKKLDEEFVRSKRHKADFSVLIIQITNYEELQAIYGELDIVNILKAVAETIQKCVRLSDCKFLINDDTLSVVLAETNEAGARVVIEKLHLSLERVTVTVEDGVKKVVRIKPSIACAALHEVDSDSLEIYERAKAELSYDRG